MSCGAGSGGHLRGAGSGGRSGARRSTKNSRGVPYPGALWLDPTGLTAERPADLREPRMAPGLTSRQTVALTSTVAGGLE